MPKPPPADSREPEENNSIAVRCRVEIDGVRYFKRTNALQEPQTMPENPPLTAAGPRDPQKQRARPIPANVRQAIGLMVYGRDDDEDCKALDLIEAAKAAGMKPHVLRRWLDRSNVRAYLLAERRTFRAAVCAGNEAALQKVRDKSPNGMAVVASVRALEQIDEEGPTGRPHDPNQQPGVTIRIVNVVQQTPASSAAPMIEINPPPSSRPMSPTVQR